MKICLIFLAAIPNLAGAGLFGPSTFEECILDGMKGVRSDAAASAIAYACRSKFPDKSSRKPEPLPIPESNNLHVFSVVGANRPAVNVIVSNLTIVRNEVVQTGDNSYGYKSYDYGHYLAVDITNRNEFPIALLEIGIRKGKDLKSCSSNAVDYAEIHSCTGSASGQQTGRFSCKIPGIEKIRFNFCVLGFGLLATETQINEFMKKYNIPKRTP